MIDRRLGSTDTTAQVNPATFTGAMMRAAQEHGAQLRIGEVTGVTRQHGAAAVTGVAVGGETLEADAVVIAMGPWSAVAAGWLPLPAVFGDKSHSLLFETGGAVPADALFLEVQETSGVLLAPEVCQRHL